jgi:resuscitation-promoting factor RpfB
LVEHATENCGVAGSFPALGTQKHPWFRGVFAFSPKLSVRISRSMLNKTRFLLPLGLVLGIGLLAFFTLYKSATLQIDGQPQEIHTIALTVGDALRSAGYSLLPEDHLQPPANAWFASGSTIELDRARWVSVYFKGIPLTIFSSERLPEKILAQVGIPFTPSDQLYLDGQRILSNQLLPPLPQYTLQVRPSVLIMLIENKKTQPIQSTAPTLGQALWEAGIQIHPGDRLSPPAETLLSKPVQVILQRAVPVTIQLQDREIFTHLAAPTVGDALAEAGISLQNLDYSSPAEGQPLPAGGRIRVMRVKEEISLQQTVIPFKTDTQSDPETEFDQQRVIQAGQSGLKVARQRIRFENGKEVTRTVEDEWVASEPKTQIVGLGTKAVAKKMDTPDGPIEYYRELTVYATSYSPCRQGMGKCSKSTSSGTPLQKGVIAVTLPWYNQLAGQRIYVPGYGVGVIADVGGGIPGTYWIDLGYGEEDFTNWHQSVKIYFLTPIPASVPWHLP